MVDTDVHVLPDNGDEARRLQFVLLLHGEATVDMLGDVLFAATFSGTCTPRGNRGLDVNCPKFGRVEVRSRVLGTDGQFPRITCIGFRRENSTILLRSDLSGT